MARPDPDALEADARFEVCSLWSLKPWWCQPWSILLTGMVTIGGSWVVGHRWWLTVPVALAVLLWWWVFLVLAPSLHRQEGGQG